MAAERLSDFDLAAVYAALDAQRQARGLTWRQTMQEINRPPIRHQKTARRARRAPRRARHDVEGGRRRNRRHRRLQPDPPVTRRTNRLSVRREDSSLVGPSCRRLHSRRRLVIGIHPWVEAFFAVSTTPGSCTVSVMPPAASLNLTRTRSAPAGTNSYEPRCVRPRAKRPGRPTDI